MGHSMRYHRRRQRPRIQEPTYETTCARNRVALLRYSCLCPKALPPKTRQLCSFLLKLSTPKTMLLDADN
eukprot:8781410-Pyramimonas_sp.AAC.1